MVCQRLCKQVGIVRGDKARHGVRAFLVDRPRTFFAFRRSPLFDLGDYNAKAFKFLPVAFELLHGGLALCGRVSKLLIVQNLAGGKGYA